MGYLLRKHCIYLLLATCFYFNIAYSNGRYFLCGADEDGCNDSRYEYCFCIPYNELAADMPYCLDFDTLSCKPLAQTSNCGYVYKNQNACLATLFQSEDLPPCQLTSYDFCVDKGSYICDADGRLGSCHR